MKLFPLPRPRLSTVAMVIGLDYITGWRGLHALTHLVHLS